jgi:hypothetical protein
MFQSGDLRCPIVDRDLSLKRIERKARIAFPDQEGVSDDTTPDPLGLSLAAYRVTTRLSYGWHGEWAMVSPRALRDAITYYNQNSFFFTDATFVTSDVHDSIVEALQTKRVLTTDGTRREVEQLAEAIPRTRLLETFLGGVTVPDFPSVPGSAAIWHPQSAFEYYLGLLAFRKLFFGILQNDLEKATDRLPSDEEWRRACEEFCGLGGLRLAEEGRRRQSDPSLFNGERLLVRALMMAIGDGTDAVLLTRDPLLMDQFVRLSALMREHYLAMVMADRIADEPERFAVHYTWTSANIPQNVFSGDTGFSEFSESDLQSVLPQRPHLINLHCWLFSGDDHDAPRLSVMSVCVERPMLGLLQVKAATGGRNTDRFGDRNVHCVELPPESGRPQRALALLTHDRLVEVGSKSFPQDDRLGLAARKYPAVDLVHVVNKGLSPDVPDVLGKCVC